MRRLSIIHYSVFLLIILSFVLRFIFYFETGHNHSPIIEFEFVQTSQEVENIFFSDKKLKVSELKGVQLQNQIDYLYMIVYTSFLILTFIKIKRIEARKFYWFGIVFSLIALMADVFENIQLDIISFSLLSTEDYSAALNLLHIFTYTKYLSLAICFILIAIHYFSYRLIGKIFAFFSITPLVVGLISLFSSNKIFTINFSLLIIIAFIQLMIWVFISNKIKTFISFYKEE